MGRVSKMIQKERVLGSWKHYQKHKHITTITLPITATVKFYSPNSRIYMCDFTGGENMF